MQCNACSEDGALRIFSGYPGHIPSMKFDIYHCPRCDANFAYPNEVDRALYNEVYAADSPSNGYYGALYEQARMIKSESDPLRFLSNSTHNYFAVVRCVDGKHGLDVLEVGCGYGYLTWALNQSGHHAVGIDVSENAIRFAKGQFGSMYEVGGIEDFIASHPDKKFDLLIAVEVIEHVPRPGEFIRACASLLKKHGRLVLTTPNKGFFAPGTVWTSDLPPIHVTLLGPHTFSYLAKKNKMELSFVDFSKHLAVREKLNKAVTLVMSRLGKQIDGPTSGGAVTPVKSVEGSFLRRALRRILIDFAPVRNLCNACYQAVFRGAAWDSTLGVVMWNH